VARRWEDGCGRKSGTLVQGGPGFFCFRFTFFRLRGAGGAEAFDGYVDVADHGASRQLEMAFLCAVLKIDVGDGAAPSAVEVTVVVEIRAVPRRGAVDIDLFDQSRASQGF